MGVGGMIDTPINAEGSLAKRLYNTKYYILIIVYRLKALLKKYLRICR